MRPTEDNYRHKGLRKKLTDGIRAKGISDEKVLNAIHAIPRHFFWILRLMKLPMRIKRFP